MMKWMKAITLSISVMLLVSGCIPQINKPEDSQIQLPNEIVTPVIPYGEKFYQTSLPYLPNKTKGTIATFKNRLDANRLELGLIELAQTKFDPGKYLFQEGQILSTDDVEDWLGRYHPEKNTLGLNPEQGSNILIHILEHDYINAETKELAGIVLGLSINPIYTVTENNEKKTTVMDLDAQRAKAEEYGTKIVQRIRAMDVKVPIMVAGFVLEPDSSMIPGHFINYGTAGREDENIESWENIDERYVLYPGKLSKTDREKEIGGKFSDLQEKVREFFAHYAGVIGLARFISDKPVELTITVHAEYSSKTEVIALTQYISGLLPELFPDDMKINIYIQSIDQPEAVYIRPIDGDPFFHVYR